MRPSRSAHGNIHLVSALARLLPAYKGRVDIPSRTGSERVSAKATLSKTMFCIPNSITHHNVPCLHHIYPHGVDSVLKILYQRDISTLRRRKHATRPFPPLLLFPPLHLVPWPKHPLRMAHDPPLSSPPSCRPSNFFPVVIAASSSLPVEGSNSKSLITKCSCTTSIPFPASQPAHQQPQSPGY
jgi:hypothetical protein